MLNKFKNHMEKQRLKKIRRQESFLAHIWAEYDNFHAELLSESKTKLYEDAFKVYFYQAILDYLTDESNLEYLDEMLLGNPYPISTLWAYYIGTDWTAIDSWESIDQLIEAFCDHEKRAA